MSSYSLCLYRYTSPFRADLVRQVLEVVARHLPRAFPMTLPVAVGQSVAFARPEDWDPSVVPPAFQIDERSEHIPLHGADGIEIAICDDRAPRMTPANVVLTWPTAPPLALALPLLRDLISTLAPDQAHLTDDETAADDEIYDRMLRVDGARVPRALFWVTWLAPHVVAELAPGALAALALRARIEPLAGGQLVILQDEPTVDAAACAARRCAAEDALGLNELHRRFPFDPDAPDLALGHARLRRGAPEREGCGSHLAASRHQARVARPG